MNFVKATDVFLNHIKLTRSDGTYRFQKQKTVALLNFFDDIIVDDINKFMLTDFVGYMKERNPDVTHETINKHLSTLKRIVRYVSDREIIYENLPTIKKKKKIIAQKSIDDVFEYLYNLMNKSEHKNEALRNYVLFKMLIDNGTRINELLRVRLNDIDFEKNIIHLKYTKTNRERYVFFTNSTKKYLEYMIRTTDIENYLFMNYRGDRRLTVDNVEKICQRLQKKLKIQESISPHAWRHTFATQYLKKGGNLEPLRQILGHTSLKTTQQYLHFDTDHNHKEYFSLFQN